jgi:Homeodomain-like domain-containing protein
VTATGTTGSARRRSRTIQARRLRAGRVWKFAAASPGRPRLVYRHDVERAIRLRDSGQTWREVGDELGIRPSTISRAVRRYRLGREAAPAAPIGFVPPDIRALERQISAAKRRVDSAGPIGVGAWRPISLLDVVGADRANPFVHGPNATRSRATVTSFAIVPRPAYAIIAWVSEGSRGSP